PERRRVLARRASREADQQLADSVPLQDVEEPYVRPAVRRTFEVVAALRRGDEVLRLLVPANPVRGDQFADLEVAPGRHPRVLDRDVEDRADAGGTVR